MTKFGSLLDELEQAGKAAITEKSNRLIVDGLTAEHARALIEKEEGLTRLTIQDSEPSDVTDPTLIVNTYEPYRIVWEHLNLPPGVQAFVTARGFSEWCLRPSAVSQVWLARLRKPFESFGVRFSPWSDDTDFVPLEIGAQPRRLVRDLSAQSNLPEQLGPYILRDGSSPDLGDHFFCIWARFSALAICRSLADEIEANDALVFRGSPIVKARMPVEPLRAFDAFSFESLQCLARWTFLSDVEVETRHSLVVAEIARTGSGINDASELFAGSAGPVLEGAKIAHQFMVQKISIDSLKALSDLRKAVSDETAKLADSTRQLAGAVGTALFAGIGALVTRLAVPIGNWPVAAALIAVGVVLCIYVAVVILSGSQFMRLQADLRKLWRSKLYRFLTDADYTVMVENPVNKAERTFRIATYVSWALTFILLIAAVAVSFTPIVVPAAASRQSIVSSSSKDTIAAPASQNLHKIEKLPPDEKTVVSVPTKVSPKPPSQISPPPAAESSVEENAKREARKN